MVCEYEVQVGGKITFWSVEFCAVGWTTEESWFLTRGGGGGGEKGVLVAP
jgi:hypothetical protein